MLQRVSSSCYKQLHDGGFMTLPNPEHLRRLSSAINIDTLKLSTSTIAYLKARFRKLKDHDRLVCILMDEVYSQTMAQFVNGRIYGAENGSFTKTLLSVMVKSITSKYRDIIVMTPLVNINASIIFKIWDQVLEVVTEIGFDVAVTMTDGVSSNMSFFKKKMLEHPGDTFCLNRYNIESKIFACYDPSHLFKNFCNNWRNTRNFECPSFDSMAEDKVFPSISHLEELHVIEKGQPEKMAYKFNEKVLHPQVMEKTNVKLADSIFHESTINALMYYSNHKNGHFKDSAIYARVIRDWFNTVNVKSIDYGKRQRDDKRNSIR